MKVQRVEMFVVPMDAPNDVSGLQALACPVCGKADLSGYAATRRVVPRHFVKPGAASPAGRETAAAWPATNLDTERITISA